MEHGTIRERFGLSAAMVGIGGMAFIGCSDSEPTVHAPDETVDSVEFYEVVDVVDGDTLKLNFQDKTESIRLIGIDTPETVHPNQPVECFGSEASAHAHMLLDGESVAFRPDEFKDSRDKYGRLLGYVFMEDGSNFALEMIEDGYAYEYTYRTEEYEFQDEFKTAEDEARQAERGLWAADTCNGEQTPVQEPTDSTAGQTVGKDTCEPNQTKGNINDRGKRIYHPPGSRYYEQTVIDTDAGEKCFVTTSEAEAAGWAPSAG